MLKRRQFSKEFKIEAVWVERFDNPVRRHSTLGYVSPIDFEKQALLA